MFASKMTVDSETDDDILMEPALVTLPEEDDDFDLNIPPTSGSEYIRRVRQEAKDCPGIVVANLDTSVFQHKQTVNISEESGCLSAPKHFIPSIAWQKSQVTYFAEIRQKLARHKERMKKDTKYSQKLPGANDAEGWCRLCFGRIKLKRQSQQVIPLPEEGDGGGVTKGQTDKCDAAGSVASTEQIGGVPPLLSIIAAMDQPRVVNVLEFHLNWFKVTGFSPHQKPLTPETCSLLRNLSRDCAHYRAKLKSPTDPDITPLNLLICLVGRYFGQTDLADNE